MLRVTYDYYVFDSIYAYSKREYHNLFGLKIPHIMKTSYKTKDNVIFVLPKFKETGLWTRKSESFL